MRSRKVHEAQGLRIFVAVLEIGDEVTDCLTRLAREERLTAAQVSAIGAFETATLAFFDWEKKEYEKIPVQEQTEVLSLAGDIADEKGEPKLHLHAVLGRRGGATIGGHLMQARIRPTLEVIVTESPAHLRRAHDEQSGLALIRP
ncbi:MAG: DNA-binding protein [Acetobacteraceae bacterium]|nr:DNA-binding protein [Acetobacteraceae bacterium]